MIPFGTIRDTVASVSDLILLILVVDAGALLLLGLCASVVPADVLGFLVAASCGAGMLLSLLSLISDAQGAVLTIPAGPPGLVMHCSLDPLALFFLVIVFLAGTALATFQTMADARAQAGFVRRTAFCVAGAVLALLAADRITMVIGFAIACGAMCFLEAGLKALLLVPLLILAAICLLTSEGNAAHFVSLRAAPVDPALAVLAVTLLVAAVAGLASMAGMGSGWTPDALAAGILIPSALYLLLRLIVDLDGVAQAGWGSILMVAGSMCAAYQSWRATAFRNMQSAAGALMRRQAALATAGVGLFLTARAADLPEAAVFALQSTCLTVVVAALAGSLMSLSVHTIGASTGTYSLARLGGLLHAMPVTSAGLAVGLLALSALPPGAGFASLWLSFQSILAAPRTGGLPSQAALALTATALASSGALATAASVRLIGIALLGRPRTPQSASAPEVSWSSRALLLTLAGGTGLAGLIPGPLIWLLAGPAIAKATELDAGYHGSRLFSMGSAASGAAGGYLAIPVFAMLALATGAAVAVSRRAMNAAKPVGPWTGGLPPSGVPFDAAAAQSDGAGFLPALPNMTLPRLPTVTVLPRLRLPRLAGLYMALAAAGVLLLVLALMR